MSAHTKSHIQWTQYTANPWHGCSKHASGCANCYAESFAGKQFWGENVARKDQVLAFIGKVKSLDAEHASGDPMPPHKRILVFPNSLCDIFEDHPMPNVWRGPVFDCMDDTSAINFQLLTKRPEVMVEYLTDRYGTPIPDKFWCGTSVARQADADKNIPVLAALNTSVSWISAEPLVEDVELSAHIDSLDWVVCGGESVDHLIWKQRCSESDARRLCRRLDPDWARSMRDQCCAAGVPFFFKQWGSWGPDGRFGSKNRRQLDGRTWDEMPEVYREG